jgi:hypothetical protein
MRDPGPLSRDEAAELRKRLRSASPPVSPRAHYVAAAAVSIVGIVSVLGAESRPIYISGWLILGFCALWAVRTFVSSRQAGQPR